MPSPTPREPRTRLASGRLAAVVLFSLAVVVTGCNKGEDEDRTREMPAPIGEREAERGAAACKAYVARACTCAEAKPDSAELAELCHLAPAKAKSLDMVLRVNRSPKDVKERVKSEQTARRIIASCIAEMGKLDSRGCPRQPD